MFGSPSERGVEPAVQVDQDGYRLVVDPPAAVTASEMVGERPGGLAGGPAS
jgi:hypothetical protein